MNHEPISVSLKEAAENIEFMIDMCYRNRCVWRIEREDGSAVLLSPIIQSAPPINEEVINQVEEFRKQFLESNEDPKLAAPFQEGTQEKT
jgi:hypothetical protein